MTPDLIAEQILARRLLARGVVVLDENLGELEPALREANIKVVKLAPGLDEDYIRNQLLPHRVLVTSNPADFVDDAPVYEYGVIALDKLGIIDPAPAYKDNKTVQLLSEAMSRYGLWARGARFLLELRDDGNHQLSELT